MHREAPNLALFSSPEIVPSLMYLPGPAASRVFFLLMYSRYLIFDLRAASEVIGVLLYLVTRQPFFMSAVAKSPNPVSGIFDFRTSHTSRCVLLKRLHRMFLTLWTHLPNFLDQTLHLRLALSWSDPCRYLPPRPHPRSHDLLESDCTLGGCLLSDSEA